MYSYAFWGLVKWILYNELTDDVELPKEQLEKLSSESECCAYGIRRKETFKIILLLSMLFALDSFGGGFTVNSFISFWFGKKWDVTEGVIGWILMVCNIVASVGGVFSSQLVKRYGAVPTMLLSHVPASLLIAMIPLMPTKTMAFCILVMRYSLSNMNLSARQTYVATLVRSDERSAAGGISNIARSFGLSFAPLILGWLMDQPVYSLWFSMPFYLGGGVRLLYDLLIWMFYRSQRDKAHSRLKYTGLKNEDQLSMELP